MIRLSNGIGVVRVFAVFAVFAVLASELHAAEIKTLYQAQMMVPDQGRKSRMETFSLALAPLTPSDHAVQRLKNTV
jgi:hypothetical protein